MPHTTVQKFGPGSMESLTLTTWVSKREGDNLRYKARLEGTYTVYCGNGWEHDVQIKEETSGWLHEMDQTGATIAKIEATGEAHEFVGEMINWALEDWFDPCDLEDEL